MSKVPKPNRAVSWSRRKFLGTVAAGTGGLVFIGAGHGAERKPKRVALLATEVRKYSHAQHFIDRLLEGYGWDGEHHYPALKLAGLFVDQFPEGDLSRDRCERHGVPLYPTVPEALTLGGSKLEVDGVLIIAEHGRYPRNEKGQTLYPRYKFFKQVTDVFKASGRSVPVFNDKHLSTDWAEAVEMVAESRSLGFPFLAGSSLPVTWRIPAAEPERNTPLEESVCVCYGGVDSYDFHGFETAQCMSERREGGEAGVRSVLAMRGDRVWEELKRRPRTADLVLNAAARSHTAKPRPGYTVSRPSLDWMRECVREPVGFFMEHDDGFRTSVFLMSGYQLDFTYAGRIRGGRVLSCQMHLPMPPRQTTLANFFNPLMHHIEQTILTERVSYPVERSLLTTGMTAFGVESLHRQGVLLETPQLKVPYQPAAESTFWRT